MEPGGEEMKVQIRAVAGVVERVLEITVTCGNCETDPAVIPIPNMVSIPAGTFTMGSPITEPWGGERQTLVTISRGFCMGRYEVTQREYLELTGSNPSIFVPANGYFEDLNRPVDNVSFYDCQNYCAILTDRERNAGRLPPSYVYRLPTEAACLFLRKARPPPRRNKPARNTSATKI